MAFRKRKPVPVHNLKVSRKGKVKKRSVLWRWRRLFYLGSLVSVAGLAGLIYVIGRVELPVDPKVAPVVDQTTYVCSSEVQVNCNAQNAMAVLHGAEDRELVTYEQIPDVLKHAVLATEDKDFFRHGGVDPIGIARAAYQDIRGGARQGGSTITQQYVKLSYLTSEQTIIRKIKEAAMAIKLEQQISKEEILTRDRNTVYFGRGAYGVQAASRAWFGHDIVTINAGEAAFLAGLLRNPNGADPHSGQKGIAEAARRRAVTLNLMVEEQYLSQAEADRYNAVDTDPEVLDENGRPFTQPRPEASTLGEKVKGEQWGSTYFAEHVRRWLVKEFGSETAYGGGLKVYTTLDLTLQKHAYDAVTTTLNQEGDPAGSIVAIDDQGRVRAMMGGTDFEASQVNLATGRQGGGSGRQPGSTFKTFALAEAMRQGYSVQSIVPSPTKVELTDPACAKGVPSWNVRGGPGGYSSLVSATKRSMNTVYAELMVQLGPEAVINMARDLGVSAADETFPRECSVVLGAGEVSVLDMAAAYSTFANGGVAKTPIVVTRVEFPDGTVKNYEPETKTVLTPEQNARVHYALEQVIQGGTGASAAIGRPAAGKTGTTQSNVDSWFVGYTPKLTAAVWMGYPNGQIPMKDVHGIEVQGGTFPAEMWRKFMSAAVADTEVEDFPEVDPSVLSEGELLNPTLGRTSVVVGSGPSGDGTGTQSTAPTPTTQPPATTAPQSQTTAPATTAPPVTTTAPPATTSAPPTTSTPAGGGGDGDGDG